MHGMGPQYWAVVCGEGKLSTHSRCPGPACPAPHLHSLSQAASSSWELLQYKPEILEDNPSPLAGADTLAAIEKFHAARKKPGNLIGQGEMFSIDYIRYSKGQLDPGVPKISASSDAHFYMTRKTGSLYYLIDGLTAPNRVEYTWKPQSKDKKPWLEFRLSSAAPLKLVNLYSPCGNLKSGKVIVNGKTFPFSNADGKTEIPIPLDGAQSDLVRIEFEKFSYPADGDDVSKRLLTEVEIY